MGMGLGGITAGEEEAEVRLKYMGEDGGQYNHSALHTHMLLPKIPNHLILSRVILKAHHLVACSIFPKPEKKRGLQDLLVFSTGTVSSKHYFSP